MPKDKVWTLFYEPRRVKPNGCKWVFKKKTDMVGKVATYKAKLGVKRC